ncbi:cyclin-dependent kinase 9 [Caerostris darwini]|uniref:Cyclin-dependent kinase 9 n=1 Tax=Caerostris darwini TaxID=1538125 RepID=A0AAV4QL77_9ARAC|nr:cyclin-dependent kinase 9 [Caerostris darwini]
MQKNNAELGSFEKNNISVEKGSEVVEETEYSYCPNVVKYEKPAKIGQETFGNNISLEKGSEVVQETEYPYCPNVAKYEKLAKIGQGTFGEVFKAVHRSSRKVVALKKVLMENEKEGFPITALREIKILQLLKHENIVNLIEICSSKATSSSKYPRTTFYLVFDFCEHDLAGLLSNVKVKFSLGEIKMIMKQILRGLYFIHSNKILHRDMKAANILITKNGVLKLADFGLARAFGGYNQPNRYTNRVVTLWYRPPELLLGERNYGPPIDIWGAGCIMAEMWTRSPIMQGVNEQHQLNLICQFCGSIVPETFPGCETLELYKQIRLPKDLKRKVKERLKPWVKDENALELLDKMLQIHPSRRIDSDNALDHDFFWSDPMPCELKILDTVQTSNFTYINSNAGKQEIRPQKITRNEEQYFDRVF